jgi:hypothetical protein
MLDFSLFGIVFLRGYLGVLSKMYISMNFPKYTAEKIAEIIDRIATLRMRWLRQVETRLAFEQNRQVIDHSERRGEPELLKAPASFLEVDLPHESAHDKTCRSPDHYAED